MTEETTGAAAADELTGEQKRQNVVRLAFGNSEEKFKQFVDVVL